MATGALDANGIWRPGEDDLLSSPTWSAYMDKIPASVSALLGGAWTTVTPTFTNLTVGSGALYGRLKKIGNTVTYMGQWTFGAGSAVGATPTITLPVASIAGYGVGQMLGSLILTQAGATNQVGAVQWQTTTTARLLSTTGLGLSATAPWTWAVGDRISWTLTYEPA